jgi:hypothetical protein
MKALALAVALAAPALGFVFCSLASAGPTGPVDPHAAPATGFPGAYLGSVSLSLQRDPLFGSRLLDSFQLHLRSIAAMTAPRAAASYLEGAVIGAAPSAAAVKAELGVQPFETPRASALLIANALARPDQFNEILDGLEARKAGLGVHMARILRETKGHGDPGMLAALRKAGERDPRKPLTYDRFARFNAFFDGSGLSSDALTDQTYASPVASPEGFTGYGPDGLPRRSGLSRPPRD